MNELKMEQISARSTVPQKTHQKLEFYTASDLVTLNSWNSSSCNKLSKT